MALDWPRNFATLANGMALALAARAGQAEQHTRLAERLHRCQRDILARFLQFYVSSRRFSPSSIIPQFCSECSRSSSDALRSWDSSTRVREPSGERLTVTVW
jgi:hypothetical protein